MAHQGISTYIIWYSDKEYHIALIRIRKKIFSSLKLKQKISSELSLVKNQLVPGGDGDGN